MGIFKSSIIKKILGIVVVIGCSGIFLNGYVGVGELVHAQAVTGIGTTTAPTGIDTMGLWQILNMILKIIYVLLWPLLVIAGLALDNTLVYASVFHMDAPLWKFWNIMKNFANFTLGFMVLFAIIKSLLTNSGGGSFKDEKSPLGIIKKTLIAGILIQASRFLMAALVDVSTIATYAVGGLPLSILQNDTLGQTKILTTNSTLDLNKFDIISAGGQGFSVWYSTNYLGKTLNLSPCRIENDIIVGRLDGDPKFDNTANLQSTPYAGYNVCVLYGNQLVLRKEQAFILQIAQNNPQSTQSNRNTTQGYKATMDELLSITGWDTTTWVQTAISDGTIVSLSSGSTAWAQQGKDFFALTNGMTLADLISKSKGFVGPLVTMYSSMLNFAQLTDTSITSVGQTSGIFLIKAGVAIALFFPLLALAVVLIARVGLLWLFIVASPFIVLNETFSGFIDVGALKKYLSIKGVIGIVFAPVVTVAALSLSLIFMSALLNGFKNTNTAAKSTINTEFNTQTIPAITTGNDAVSFGGIAQLEFTKLPRGDAMDRFSWMMVNFFAIGLLRMIFFAAIQANELGKAVAEPIQKFGEKTFQTLPILPVPGGGGERVGVGSAATVIGGLPEAKLQQFETRDVGKVHEFIYGPTENAGTGSNSLSTTNATALVNSLAATANKEEAQSALTKIGYSTDTITNNIQAISTALNEMKKPEEKEKALAGIKLVDEKAFNDISKLDATTKFTTDIGNQITSTDQTKADIEKLVNDKKAIADEYFKYNPTPYTKTIDDGSGHKTKITITATPDPKDSKQIIYNVVVGEPSAPTPPTTPTTR